MGYAMSKEAMKYVSTIEIKYHTTRNLLKAIARKTFNDSCLCRAGIEGLVQETGYSRRSLTRYLGKLKELGLIAVHPRHGAGFGRPKDDIEIVGFKAWLHEQSMMTPHAGATMEPIMHDEDAKMGGMMQPLVTPTYIDQETSTLIDKSKRQEPIYHDRILSTLGADTTQKCPPQGQLSEEDWSSLEHSLTLRVTAEDYHADCCDRDEEVLP